jgi:UDP:flavonoid glycosyltransferase YjiC (YdhE family)
MSLKRIFLVAPPFSGHLHPLLGIALRLQSVGEVTVLSTPSGVRAAQSSGLSARAILAEDEAKVWAIAEPGTDVKSNPLLLYRQLKANVALMGKLKAELEAIYLTEKPDLVIADFTVPVAGIAAQQHGIAWWTTLPSPCVFETRDGPPAYFGGQTPAKTWQRRAVHTAMRAMTRVFKRGMFRMFRSSFQALGFENIYRDDGSEAVYSPAHVFALGVSELEFPATQPAQFHLIGPVLHTPPSQHPAPAFANDGRPHVLISIGTHLPHAKATLAETMREIAARHSSIEFHFSHGQVKASNEKHEGNFHEYAFVSYSQHLPRYALVIHHAGAGVMNHCLHHGIPAVVYPLDFDQFDNAVRLVAAGVALRAKGQQDIEQRMVEALADSALQSRCRAMSQVMRRYDAEGFIAKLVEAMQ